MCAAAVAYRNFATTADHIVHSFTLNAAYLILLVVNVKKQFSSDTSLAMLEVY